MPPSIYYKGIGAKKNGKHTEKEFLNMMKQTKSKACSLHKFTSSYSPCVEMNKLEKIKKKHETPTYYRKQKKCTKANNTTTNPNCVYVENIDKKWEASNNGKKFKKSFTTCLHNGMQQTIKKKLKPCTLDEYITYSGATRKK